MAFHSLTVTDIHRTTPEAVVLTLRPDTPERFQFTQGQYLTFRQTIDGTELRRNYSICSGLDDGLLQVGIKKVDGGAFSSFANEQLKIGDQLEAMPPQGRFFVQLEPDNAHEYVGFAGGSGITPILSILRTVLKREPKSQFTLVYANRAINTIMFREELEDLKNRYMGRLTVVHILESGQDIDLFSGRIDQTKCAALFRQWIDPLQVRAAFICGPEPMMLAISESLETHGLAKDRIKVELFTESQQGRLARRKIAQQAKSDAQTQVEMTVEGVTRRFEMPRNQSVLEAALQQNLDAPFSCKAGVCSTCKARLLEGEVELLSNHALEDGEIARGLILTCQAYPLTDRIKVEYDTH